MHIRLYSIPTSLFGIKVKFLHSGHEQEGIDQAFSWMSEYLRSNREFLRDDSNAELRTVYNHIVPLYRIHVTAFWSAANGRQKVRNMHAESIQSVSLLQTLLAVSALSCSSKTDTGCSVKIIVTDEREVLFLGASGAKIGILSKLHV